MDIKTEIKRMALGLSKEKAEDNLWKLSEVRPTNEFLSKTRLDVEFTPANIERVNGIIKSGKLSDFGLKKQETIPVVKYLQATLEYLKNFESTSTVKIHKLEDLIKTLVISQYK